MKTLDQIITEALSEYHNTNYVPGDKTKTIENNKIVDIVIDNYDNGKVNYTRNDGTKGSQPVDMFEDTSTYIKTHKKDPYVNIEEIEEDDEISEDGEGVAPVSNTSGVATTNLPLPMKVLKRKYDEYKGGNYIYNVDEDTFNKFAQTGPHPKKRGWEVYVDTFEPSLAEGVKYYSKFGNVAFRNPATKGLRIFHKRG